MELLAEVFRQRTTRVKSQGRDWLGRVTEILHAKFQEPVMLSELAADVSAHPVHLAMRGTACLEFLKRLYRISTTDAPDLHNRRSHSFPGCSASRAGECVVAFAPGSSSSTGDGTLLRLHNSEDAKF